MLQVVVDKVMKRVQWERAQKKTSDQKKQEEETERNAMASIDWHDFVVVQTIEFDDPEDAPVEEEIPEPIAIEDVPVEKEDVIEDVEMDVEEDEVMEVPTNLKVRTNFDVRSRPSMNRPLFFLKLTF